MLEKCQKTTVRLFSIIIEDIIIKEHPFFFLISHFGFGVQHEIDQLLTVGKLRTRNWKYSFPHHTNPKGP
jgi:hypothetical protein